MRSAEFALVLPEHVAGVAVAVQAQRRDAARLVVAALDAFQRLLHGGLPRVREVFGHEAVVEQPFRRLVAEALLVKGGTLAKRREASDGVDAADEAAHPFERFAALQL